MLHTNMINYIYKMAFNVFFSFNFRLVIETSCQLVIFDIYVANYQNIVIFQDGKMEKTVNRQGFRWMLKHQIQGT